MKPASVKEIQFRNIHICWNLVMQFQLRCVPRFVYTAENVETIEIHKTPLVKIGDGSAVKRRLIDQRLCVRIPPTI